MTYEMFFETVKNHQKKAYFGDLPEYKLVEFMKSQEDVIQDQYDYWNWQVEENQEDTTEESVAAMASGAAYSLYLLYEGQVCFNRGGVYICTFLAGKNGTIIYGGSCLLCVFVRYYSSICFIDGAKMKE